MIIYDYKLKKKKKDGFLRFIFNSGNTNRFLICLNGFQKQMSKIF